AVNRLAHIQRWRRPPLFGSMEWDRPALRDNGGRHSWIRRLFRAAQRTSDSFSSPDFFRACTADALECPGRTVCHLVPRSDLPFQYLGNNTAQSSERLQLVASIFIQRPSF